MLDYTHIQSQLMKSMYTYSSAYIHITSMSFNSLASERKSVKRKKNIIISTRYDIMDDTHVVGFNSGASQ